VSALEVKRPLTATVGAVLSIIGVLLYLTFLLIGLSVLSEEPLTGAESASFLFELIYTFFYCILGLVGAFYILRRKYAYGGVAALICGILLTITMVGYLEGFAITVLPIIGGILSLVSKEKTSLGVLGVAKLYGRLKIADLAAKLGKTEADVELAVIELQSKGEPIKFEAETREVIYTALGEALPDSS